MSHRLSKWSLMTGRSRPARRGQLEWPSGRHQLWSVHEAICSMKCAPPCSNSRSAAMSCPKHSAFRSEVTSRRETLREAVSVSERITKPDPVCATSLQERELNRGLHHPAPWRRICYRVLPSRLIEPPQKLPIRIIRDLPCNDRSQPRHEQQLHILRDVANLIGREQWSCDMLLAEGET